MIWFFFVNRANPVGNLIYFEMLACWKRCSPFLLLSNVNNFSNISHSKTLFHSVALSVYGSKKLERFPGLYIFIAVDTDLVYIQIWFDRSSMSQVTRVLVLE